MNKQSSYEKICAYFLSLAGITLNGKEPWDIQVLDQRIYKAVLKEGSLAFGKAYMDGWWECKQLDQLFERICKAELYYKIKNNWKIEPLNLLHKILNYQGQLSAKLAIKKHYDLGNQLFETMLGSDLTYSCGYWKNANTLKEAQNHKHELICNKLQLQPGMKLLDIGCGWGSMAIYAARNFRVEVIGITISKEQYELAKTRCKTLPIQIYLKDYREINGTFDRIVSIGMFEHVGYKNYSKYFKLIHNLLNNNGLFLLHTIGRNISSINTDPWIDKYIFPNGVLPSIAQIGAASEKFLVMEDWHNFGIDYVKTLKAWHHNFITNYWQLEEYYDEKFKRMWSYYLLQCVGAFKARKNQLWQIVYSKHGEPQGYLSAR